MSYIDKHRRRLVNERSIRGSLCTVSSQEREVILSNASGLPINKLTIMGNTHQPQYKGKNLINVDKFIELIQQYDTIDSSSQIVEVDGRKCIMFRPHHMAGKSFADCFSAFEDNTRYIFSCEAKPNTLLPEDYQYDGAFNIGFKGTSTVQMDGLRTLSAKTTTEFKRMYVINSEGSTVTDIILTYGSAHIWLIDLDTVYLYKYENNDNPDCEPYVGCIPSPSPLYPQLIENTIADICCNDYLAVTNIKLCQIDGYKDKLTLNWTNNSIIKHSAIELYTFTGYESIYEETDGNNKAYIVDLPSEKASETKYYCTHFSVYDGNHTVFEDIVEIIDNKAWFYNPTVDLVALLKTGEVQIAYVKNYPDSENVTDTARELFKLTTPYRQDAVLEVEGASSIEATYYSYENEDKLTLTVHYKSEDKRSLKDSNTYSIREGSRYTVIAPKIDGYEPLQTEYEGHLTKDDEITITYKEKK